MESNGLDLLINIDNKIDDVKNKIHSIEISQTRMEGDLKYHIKRTDLLEQKVFEIDEKIKPVETAKNATTGFFKAVAFLAGIAGALFAFLRNIKQ